MNKHSPKSVNTVASCFLKMVFLDLVLFIMFILLKIARKGEKCDQKNCLIWKEKCGLHCRHTANFCPFLSLQIQHSSMFYKNQVLSGGLGWILSISENIFPEISWHFFLISSVYNSCKPRYLLKHFLLLLYCGPGVLLDN